MRVRRDLGLAEAAHLGRGSPRASRRARRRRSSPRPARRGSGRRGGRGSRRCCRSAIRVSTRVGAEARDRRGAERPSARQAHDLALAHRDAAEDLVEIFADADARRAAPRSRRSGPRLEQAARIGRELAHRLGIGGEPGEPVRGVLLGLEPLGRNAAVRRRPRPRRPPASPRRRARRRPSRATSASEIRSRHGSGAARRSCGSSQVAVHVQHKLARLRPSVRSLIRSRRGSRSRRPPPRPAMPSDLHRRSASRRRAR